MHRRPIHRNIELRFVGNKEPLSFLQVRELYLQAHAWKGLPAKMQRERLESMREKFIWLEGLFDRVHSGEQTRSVAASVGISAEVLSKWLHGKALPRIVSPTVIQFNTQRRLNHLKEAALKNPRIGYILGARMSGHLSVYVTKKGGVAIISALKKGSIEGQIRKAQSEVFGYRIESKTRVLRKNSATPSIASMIRASSVEVASFLNRETFFGSRIPFKFLKNRATRRQFAMALIDANAFPFQRSRPGRKKPEAGILFKTRNMELRDYLSKLLSEFGIKNNPRGVPILPKKERWEAFKEGGLYQKGKIFELFVPKTSLERFRKEVGFRDPQKAQLLERLISQE